MRFISDFVTTVLRGRIMVDTDNRNIRRRVWKRDEFALWAMGISNSGPVAGYKDHGNGGKTLQLGTHRLHTTCEFLYCLLDCQPTTTLPGPSMPAGAYFYSS